MHGEGGQVVFVRFVPRQANQRITVRLLVDDGRMVQMSQVEHSNGTVCADRGEHIASTARLAERYITNLFIVCDQLRPHMAGDLRLTAAGTVHTADRLAGLQVPDRTGGVDWAGADQGGLDLVPIERGQRCTEAGAFVVVQQTFEFGFVCVARTPDSQVVAGGGQQIGVDAFGVGYPDDFGGRIRMIEGGTGVELASFVVQCDDLNLVGFGLRKKN